jgi:hypothetical protein
LLAVTNQPSLNMLLFPEKERPASLVSALANTTVDLKLIEVNE